MTQIIFNIPTRLNQLNIAAVQHLSAVPLAAALDARRDVVVLSAEWGLLLPLEQIKEHTKDNDYINICCHTHTH